MKCIARTKGFERCKNPVEHGNFLFCHVHRMWWIPTVGTLAIAVTTFFANIAQITGNPLFPASTLTPTKTPALMPSPTPSWTPSPQPASLSHYYMIVLDASVNMQESFDGQSKWGAALTSLSSMFEALNRNSNYGLVVVGGSSTNGEFDPCTEPSIPIIPFVSDKGALLPSDTLEMNDVIGQINQLQPIGGGSLYAAFSLAKKQLEDLPASTVKTMIFITGSNDACESRDEWSELERILQLPDLVGLYSEIIILDEDTGLITQSIAERINALSSSVNVQVSQNNQQLQQITGNVISQVNTHVEQQQAVLNNSAPANVTSIISTTSIPQVVVTSQPQTIITVPPTPIPPTPIPPTPIPQPTNIPAPFVYLEFSRYLNETENTCDAEIIMYVSGSTVTGHFHVWNASYGPDGDPYEDLTMQSVGSNSYIVGLGGNEPQYYEHKVWFEYDGTSSNVLGEDGNLICPNNR